MDWLFADLLWIFACKLRGLHNEKRRVLISPASPAVIGLYPLAQGADVAAKFRRPSGDRADLSGESGLKVLGLLDRRGADPARRPDARLRLRNELRPR